MQHLQPNTTLQGGKYRIERVLGQGGFGITYLAVQTSLQRRVAIKEFFMKDFCSRDEATRIMSAPSTGSSKIVEQYRKKFIKEARNLARLNHPHIISVIDVFEENGTVYYVMPYLIGGSLQDYVMAHGAFSESTAMKYVKQIAGALKYMHEEQHICHYDVKPANILLDDKGNAVLIDFGISKNYDAMGQETTTTPIGLSDGYAPIEQYSDMAEFSPASDVYALGATLYYLLHGKRPVKATDRVGGITLLMSKHLSQGIKDIINTSMKISKRERADSVEVFLGNVNTSAYRERTAVQNDDESTILEEKQSTKNVNTSYTKSYTNSSVGNTTATESNSNSMMGWIIGIAVAIIIGFLIYNSQGGTDNSSNVVSYNNTVEATPPSITQSQETITDISPKQNEKSTFDWSGNYFAEKDAGGTYGGTPIIFQTEFSLKRINDTQYEGTMEIAGYQTLYAPAKIKGFVNGNRIRIYFVSSRDDGINKWSDICNGDTPLLSLSITNGTIESEWYATLCESEVVDQSTPVIKQK